VIVGAATRETPQNAEPMGGGRFRALPWTTALWASVLRLPSPSRPRWTLRSPPRPITRIAAPLPRLDRPAPTRRSTVEAGDAGRKLALTFRDDGRVNYDGGINVLSHPARVALARLHRNARQRVAPELPPPPAAHDGAHRFGLPRLGSGQPNASAIRFPRPLGGSSFNRPQ